MLCSIGHGEIPNLNFYFAPSCHGLETIQLDKKFITPINICPFNHYLINPFIQHHKEIIIPKKGEIKIIKNENDEDKGGTGAITGTKKILKKIFDVSCFNSNHDTLSELNTHESHETHETHEQSIDNTVNNISFISENDITKFNNDKKLKKIHSAYHLKRKVSTKFQNQIKISVNKLIMEFNASNQLIKIPLLYPCSKTFREDVKIETLKKVKNLTIGSYIIEDIQCAGRSLNIKNFKILELIKDIAEKNENNLYIKKLYNFLFKVNVVDFYNEFLGSNSFKTCLDKDLSKYIEKLNSLKYPQEKINLYKKIFKEKYEGIAKYFFYIN